jgi:transcriptional regulator with XRE-family HTH domain
LGAELRKLRERAGLSTAEAAARLSIDRAKISTIEAGRAGVSEDRLRTLACHYDCSNEALINALIDMAKERRRHWWEEYRGILPAGFLDLAELEHHATEMRIAHAIHVPGLLQTREYARAVFEQVVPALPAYEVEHRVSHRIKRQAALHGDAPTPYTAYIHEAALRMLFGGPKTMRAQLHHLVEVSESANVKVRVVPFAAGAYPGAGQSIGYLTGPVKELDTVQLDTSHGSLLLDAQAQLDKYGVILDRMEGVSLTPEDSRKFIIATAETL